MNKHNQFQNHRLRTFFRSLLPIVLGGVLIGLVFLLQNKQGKESYEDPIPIDTSDIQRDTEYDKVVDGIHVRTGFVDGEGLMSVVTHCTACHSASLVTQNRMTREGWEQTIRWMQKTQNLWDLGANESVILDYLSTHYAPQKKGRRQNLANLEWYELNR
jgi:hypothetical protein